MTRYVISPKTPHRVAVTSISFSRSSELLEELAALGHQVVANAAGARLAGSELVRFLKDADADIAVVGVEPFDDAVLAQCPRVRFVAKYGVGLDNLDLDAMKARGVGLGWTGGVNRRSVAELVLAFALGHLRNVTSTMNAMRAGAWDKNGGLQLSGRTVGIVGFGHVGTDLARLLQPFRCELLYCDIVDKSADAGALGARRVGLDELLTKADVVSLHVPSTPQTRGMIGGARLAMMRTTALLVNTSRGDIVSFEETCAAVRDGKLGGYAADVFLVEPCTLLAWQREHPRLYFTPHIGGNAREAVLAMGRSAIGHVAAYTAAKGAGIRLK